MNELQQSESNFVNFSSEKRPLSAGQRTCLCLAWFGDAGQLAARTQDRTPIAAHIRTVFTMKGKWIRGEAVNNEERQALQKRTQGVMLFYRNSRMDKLAGERCRSQRNEETH